MVLAQTFTTLYYINDMPYVFHIMSKQHMLKCTRCAQAFTHIVSRFNHRIDSGDTHVCGACAHFGTCRMAEKTFQDAVSHQTCLSTELREQENRASFTILDFAVKSEAPHPVSRPFSKCAHFPSVSRVQGSRSPAVLSAEETSHSIRV